MENKPIRTEENRSKTRLFYAILIFMGIITTFALIAPKQQAGLINQYDPELDGYWATVPDDVTIHAFYDQTKYNNYDLETKTYALLKNQILSVDDQGLDSDTNPDLLFNSQFLLGSEEIGITIGQVFDINFIAFLLGLLGGGEMNLSQIAIPTFPSFHIVSSEFITYLDLLTNAFFYEGGIPLFSFDYESIGKFSDPSWNNYASVPNSINVIQLTGARSWSKGLEFDYISNTSTCAMSLSTIETNTNQANGTSRFWVKPSVNDTDMLFMEYNALGDLHDSNGIILKMNNTHISYLEGAEKWFDNGIIQSWVTNENEGTWTIIAPLTSDDYNLIELEFPNDYRLPFNVSVNHNKYLNGNFSVSQHAYTFNMNKIIFQANGTQGYSKVYLDDVTFTFKSADSITPYLSSFISSLPNTFWRLFSIYSLMYMPAVFNFDAFYDLLYYIFADLATMLIQNVGINDPSLRDFFTSFLINDAKAFRIHIDSSIIEEIVASLGTMVPELAGLNLKAIEGNATWYFDICWDKKISMLNQTIFHIDYIDLNIEREIGMKLIVTRTQNKVQDGYWYYQGTWWDSTYLKINRPYARFISALGDDPYPSRIPAEWNVFDPKKISEAFINEFDFSPLLAAILQENAGIILGVGAGLLGASVATGFGILKLSEYLANRKLRKSEKKPVR